MTVGELYQAIERELIESPELTSRELCRRLFTKTDATVYDIVSALQHLHRADRIERTDDDESFESITWRTKSAQ